MKEIGSKVTEIVTALGKTLTGKVIYNDPKGYFYRVEFQFDGHTIHECYSVNQVTCSW